MLVILSLFLVVSITVESISVLAFVNLVVWSAISFWILGISVLYYDNRV